VSLPESRHAGTLRDDIVQLRMLRPEDYDYLYALLALPEVGLRWLTHGLTPSPEDFRSILWRGTFVQLVVHARSGGPPLGLVSSYNVSLRNGIGYLSAIGAPRSWRSGLLLRGTALLIDHLFANWSFRKLYIETSTPSRAALGSLFGTLFVEEGCLKDYEYTAGGYRDMFIGSLSRERWETLTDGQMTVLSAAADMANAALPKGRVVDVDEFMAIVAEVTGCALGRPDLLLVDAGIDSLHLVELAALIEAASNVELDVLARIGPVHTLHDLFLLYCEMMSAPPRGNIGTGQ
jgi:RimJ/RimL family protein N-acetyltransferase